jgi:hypothetical protein
MPLLSGQRPPVVAHGGSKVVVLETQGGSKVVVLETRVELEPRIEQAGGFGV